MTEQQHTDRPDGPDRADQAAAQSPASGGPGAAAAGVPAGAAPSGATSAGTVPEDTRDDRAPAGGDKAATPGQAPGGAGSPVPSPGAAPGVTAPAVHAAQGASPDDGIHAGDKAPGSDASVTSPGAWTALAVPGKPDGEVDTRAR